MAIGFRYAARSHVGMVRSNNQDSGYAGPHLLAMADGMGGHAGGDIASSVVVSHLVDLDDESLLSGEAGEALLQRVRAANEELAERIKADPHLDGMGTTLIAILRSRNKLVLAHIGDSRAFLARDGKVTQITKDHSYVQSLVDEGRISAEDAKTHPQRSLVTRVLTGREEDEPDLAVREGRPGDRYLIASDGLTDFVATETIHEVLLSDRDPGDVADHLVQLALRAGAPDNVTVVIGDVVDVRFGRLPHTQPEVVGSAALQRRGTRPIPVTPAEKAAALREEMRREKEPEVTLADEEPTTRPVRWLRRLAVLGLTLVVLLGGGYAAYAWTQTQYYVGDDGGYVAVFRGVNQSIGPLDLSRVSTTSDVRVADLPDFYARRVSLTVSRSDEASASRLVDELRGWAEACRAARASGRTCSTLGTGGETAPPTLPTTTTPPPTTTTPATTRPATATPSP